jgi:hypothetical protein
MPIISRVIRVSNKLVNKKSVIIVKEVVTKTLSNKNNKNDEDSLLNKENWKSWGIWSILFILIVFAVYGVIMYSKLLRSDWKDWATIGDSFGIVNAFFSGLGFVGLLYTIYEQRKSFNAQIKEQRVALDRQLKQEKYIYNLSLIEEEEKEINEVESNINTLNYLIEHIVSEGEEECRFFDHVKKQRKDRKIVYENVKFMNLQHSHLKILINDFSTSKLVELFNSFDIKDKQTKVYRIINSLDTLNSNFSQARDIQMKYHDEKNSILDMIKESFQKMVNSITNVSKNVNEQFYKLQDNVHINLGCTKEDVIKYKSLRITESRGFSISKEDKHFVYYMLNKFAQNTVADEEQKFIKKVSDLADEMFWILRKASTYNLQNEDSSNNFEKCFQELAELCGENYVILNKNELMLTFSQDVMAMLSLLSDLKNCNKQLIITKGNYLNPCTGQLTMLKDCFNYLKDKSLEEVNKQRINIEEEKRTLNI